MAHKTIDKMDTIGCVDSETPIGQQTTRENYQAFADDDRDGILNWADRCPRTNGMQSNIFDPAFHDTNLGASAGFIGCAPGDNVN